MATKPGPKWALFVACLLCLLSVRLCYDFVDKCEGKVDNCYCTDSVIDCQGHEFSDIKEIYPYVTGLTFRVSITGGKLEHVPSDLFGPVVDLINGEHLYNLTFLNLSGNGINRVGEGAFDHLPNLETLDLSDNSVSVNSPLSQNPVSLLHLSVLQTLNLGNAFDTDTLVSCDLGNMFGKLNMTRLKQLDLSGNGLSIATSKFDMFMENAYSLERLNLSHNAFSHFVYGHGYGNLVEYDFSYNQMDFLTSQETDEIESMPRLKIIKFGGNPIHCDCRMAIAYDWFNSTEQPLDFDNIICKYSDNVTNVGKPIVKLRLGDFCKEPRISVCGPYTVARATAYNGLIIGLAAVVLIVVTVLSVVIAVKCRRKRQFLEVTADTSKDESKTSIYPAYTRMI